MKQTITFFDFRDAFLQSDTYKNNFSLGGLSALWNYFEGYEEDTGEEIDLDIVAICCDFAEYESFADIQEEYPEIRTISELEDNTTVIQIANSDRIIIQRF